MIGADASVDSRIADAEGEHLSEATPPTPLLESKPPTPPTGKELRSWLATAGLFDNIYADDLIQRLSDVYDTQIRTLESARTMDLAHLEEQIADAERQRQSDRERITVLQTLQQTVGEQLRNAEQELRRWSSELRGHMHLLRARRAEYPHKILAAKLHERSTFRSALAEQILQEERGRLELEKATQEIARERRKLNEEEYQRRINLLTEQRDACRKRLDEHAVYVDRLRSFGITRKLSGFLCWAGYLAFVALGWYLGQAIDQKHDPEPGFLQALFELVVAGLPNFFRAVGPLWALAFVLLAPMLALGLGGSLIYGADQLLQRFDGRWKAGTPGGRRVREAERGPLGWMGEPDEPLTRANYRQALSKLPLVYVWMVAPLFIAWVFAVSGGLAQAVPTGIDPSAAPTAATTPDSVLYTYFGVVVAVVVAAFMAAYVTIVVGPRHARVFAASSEKPATGPQMLRANWEIVAVLVLMLMVLPVADIVHGLLSGPATMDLWAVDRITAILILITANGLVIAYGMMYRGVFYDLDMLRREVSRFDRQMQRYSALPTAADPDAEHSRFERELSDLQDDIDRIWSGFEGEPELSAGGWPFGFRWRNRRKSSAEPVRSDESAAEAEDSLYDWRDARFEPAIVEEIERVNPELSAARTRATQLGNRLREVESELNALLHVDWAARFRRMRQQLEETRHRYEQRIAGVRLQSVSELLQATNARLIGSLARSRSEG